MTTQEIENLYIRSLDDTINDEEKKKLFIARSGEAGIATELSQHQMIREEMLRKVPATFGPYFAQRVISKIQNVGTQIDIQIIGFFKQYQLAAVGLLLVMLLLNAVFADQIDLISLIGLEQTTTVTDDIIAFDYYETLNKNK